MEPWVSRNNPGSQLALALGCTAVGLLFLYLVPGSLAENIRHLSFSGSRANTSAAFLLGLMLACTGLAGLFTSGSQTVTVDPQKRRITIADSSHFRKTTRIIRFDEIREVGIGFLGKRSNGVRFYYLALTLGNGENYSLFAPGRFYPGASDRAIVAGWQRRLEGYLVARH